VRCGVVAVILGFVLILVETSMGPATRLGMVRPDGLVALVVWHGMRHPLPAGILPILALGILSEPFTLLPGGVHILAFAGGYLMVRYVLNHVICPALWQQMLLVAFVSVVMVVLLLTASGAADLVWPWGFGQAVLNGLTCPLLFFCFERVHAYALTWGGRAGEVP
jgi:cell shape-determining protein MreD